MSVNKSFKRFHMNSIMCLSLHVSPEMRQDQVFFKHVALKHRTWPPHRIVKPLPRLLACVSEIESWMSSNRLELNASKTELIRIGTPRSRKKPWWSIGKQSRRWWRYGISVSSSTGSWQWRLTWAILYVAACTNSANSAASSGRWPSVMYALAAGAPQATTPVQQQHLQAIEIYTACTQNARTLQISGRSGQRRS